MDDRFADEPHQKKPEEGRSAEFMNELASAAERARMARSLEGLRNPPPPPVHVSKHSFKHYEAFALMSYEEVGVGALTGQRLLIWNSRDGVTPFALFLQDGREFTHNMRIMRSPSFDRPAGATHEWYTRSVQEAEAFRQRCLQKRIDRHENSDPEFSARLRKLGEEPLDFTREENSGLLIGLRSIVTMLPEPGF